MSMFTNQPSTFLFTDQYTLTMAQTYFRQGRNDWTAFELFARRLPRDRGYLLAAGLEDVISYLRAWAMTEDDAACLLRMGYDADFVDHLRCVRFTGDVWAVPEGTVVGPGVPLLRIEGGRIENTIIESALLAIVGQQTMLATKAARICMAAQGRAVWDFSLRRDHGVHASLGAARAGYLAGFAGTATVEANRIYGVPTAGTMAHQFIMAYGEDREQEAFEDFLAANPTRAALLIDTYDTVRGARRAVAASIATGVALRSVRIDSGDLGELNAQVRRILDEASMDHTAIFNSNDLDEHKIADLVATSPVDAFGVGTMYGTCADAPNLGVVYKIVESRTGDEEAVPTMKLAPGKQTDPGRHQVWLHEGTFTIGLMGEEQPGTPLLRQVVDGGERVWHEALATIRMRAQAETSRLTPGQRALTDPDIVPVTRTEALMRLRYDLGDVEAASPEAETQATPPEVVAA